MEWLCVTSVSSKLKRSQFHSKNDLRYKRTWNLIPIWIFLPEAYQGKLNLKKYIRKKLIELNFLLNLMK